MKLVKDTDNKLNENKQISDKDAEEAFKTILTWMGEDPNREGLLETPKRVVKAFKEYFKGYKEDPDKILDKTFGDVEGYDDMVVQKNISVQSHCEHHMAPIIGKAHVAYIPKERVVGLSKLARVVEVFSKRLQTQERLTMQIANTLMESLDAKGVAVTIDSTHQCMTMRGIKKEQATTVTNYYLGQFKEDLSFQNSSKQAMILGTAGFTSLMSAFAIKAREEILLGEKVNNVLVTGATGGVGSVAVIVLNKMGYNVTAVTGKDSKADYLKSLGAKTVVNRAEFDKDPRLIDKALWDGVVDTVGGKILANAIVQTNSNGIIAVCGNANTNELNTNVIPFMLRGIKLWGMDSANCSIKRREFIWSEAANLIDFSLLEKSIQTVSLEELIEIYPKILKGEISGRVLVDLNK